jgi:hypothetical protein
MGGRVRRLAVLAATGTALVLAWPGNAGAQEEKQQVDTAIGYLCGTQQVTLRVTATFPAQGTVGDPLQLSDITLELSVPQEALAELTAAGAVSATSVVRLDTSIVQGDTAANATWSAVRDEPVPLAEPTAFAGPVEAEPVTAGAAGDLSFTASSLVATITGRNAEGAPTEPPSIDLTCIPAPEQQAGLAVVPIADPAEPTDPTFEVPKPGIKVGTKEQGSSAAPVTALGPVPPECHPIQPPPVPKWSDFCANIGGYTNVAKLDASIMQPIGIINIAAGNPVLRCDGIRLKACSKNTALPDLNGEPKYAPATGSFFSLGVVPTIGTMQLTQLGIANVDVWFMVNAPDVGEAHARLQVSAQLLETEVMGVPLDLGPNCRTATPIDVELYATAKSYSITEGGILTSTVTIPPFTGCGVTEDLDPLVTGLVSGPGNYLKMTQGQICTINNGLRCPPEVPELER